MNDDMRYVAVGDEFEDDSWRYPETDFEKKFLEICGRKYYDTQVNSKRVKAIEKNMAGNTPKFPPLYIDLSLQYYKEKNTPRVTRKLKAVISGIRNPDNLAKFHEKHPAEIRDYDTKADFDW